MYAARVLRTVTNFGSKALCKLLEQAVGVFVLCFLRPAGVKWLWQQWQCSSSARPWPKTSLSGPLN